jgi:hypothetical protein
MMSTDQVGGRHGWRVPFSTRKRWSHARPDAVEVLGDRIARLTAHIAAATHELLVMIAEFDSLRGWQAGGHRSCAHWLAFRTQIDLGTAREKVRAARALETLPATSAAMSRGELTFSQVRALTRIANAENEAALLELARGLTIAKLEQVVRAWRCSGTRHDEAERERARFESRTLSIFPDEDGMYLVRGRLMPEAAALLMRAIDAASDQLFRERPGVGADPVKEAAQRRADAVSLVAERALAAGSGAAISGTRAARYQVVVHVDADALAADDGTASNDVAHPEISCETSQSPGGGRLEDGTRLSHDTTRRLCCDASVVRVRHDRNGGVLDVGRRTRTIPPALRRALEVRDGGCRFPGCGLRFTDAHHLRHWADAGETSLANCLLLCSHHHRLVHEGGWSVEWSERDSPVFIDPRGNTHSDARRGHSDP